MYISMVKQRYELLDTLRGFSLVNMIFYHFIWDLIYIFSVIDNVWPNLFYIWQQFICSSFIFISGFCWPLSRNHLQRGLTIFACGILITLVTYIFLPQNTIVFSILTFLGSAALFLLILPQRFLKIKPLYGFILSLCLFILSKNITRGYLGFSFCKISLPPEIYANHFTAYLGFPHDSFSSADYFPLLPWLFLFSSGYYAYQYCYAKNILAKFSRKIFPPLNFCGKHSLFIYLIHQPLIYFALSLSIDF